MSETNRLPYLDGLRGLALVLVFTHHLPQAPLRFLHGYRGVTLFFALSGFLITSLALKEERSDRGFSLGAFMTRRSFRIFPLYFLVLFLYTLTVPMTETAASSSAFLRSLPYYLSYLQEFPTYLNLPDAPFRHSWSLGIEEKFYLVWPVLAFVVLARRPRLRCIVAGLLVTSLTICTVTLHSRLVDVLLAPYIPVLTGCLAALIADDFAGWWRRLPNWSTGLVAALAAIVLLLAPRQWDTPAAILIAVGVASVATRQYRALSVLNSRFLAFLGRVSYGSYLVHLMAIGVVFKLVGRTRPVPIILGGSVVAFAVSVSVAQVLHVMVERPLIRTGRSLAARRQSQH